jgi:hypothetical protein
MSLRISFLLRRGWTPLKAPGVSRAYWVDPHNEKRVLLLGQAYTLQMERESRALSWQTGTNKKQRTVHGKPR